jgi:NIPSNAP protein
MQGLYCGQFSGIGADALPYCQLGERVHMFTSERIRLRAVGWASFWRPEEKWIVFTCVIRYRLEPGKLAAFREYAHAWIGLIRKYGGTHHGYFVPGTQGDHLPDPTFSFPGLGVAAPSDVAFALFSFPSVEAYDQYRAAVARG